MDGEKKSALCDAAIALRDAHYVVRETGKPSSGSGERSRQRKKYVLRTTGLADIWKRSYEIEDRIFAATARQLVQWRVAAPIGGEVATFHDKMAARALAGLRDLRSGSGDR